MLIFGEKIKGGGVKGAQTSPHPQKKKFTDNSFLSLPNAAQVWEWMELAVTFTKPEIPSLINSVKGLDGHINLFVCV